MEKSWDFPKQGFVKINVHAMSLPHPLPNGNNSGIGIVIRDDQGKMVKIVSGSIRNLTVRGSELWAMLAGVRSGFYANKKNIQLESDNDEAVREWLGWKWFVDQNHSSVIQQLNQRKKDPKLNLEVKAIEPSQNTLAWYLALDGARNRSRLVVFRRSFGRVEEFWRHDMGLGSVETRFDEIEEQEFVALQNQNEVVNVNVVDEDSDDEGLWLMEGVNEDNMGQQQ